MKTLEQFKAEMGIEKIQFAKNEKTGTQQCEIGKALILMRADVDIKKPLYVGRITKNKKGEEIKEEVYSVFNSKLVEGDTI